MTNFTYINISAIFQLDNNFLPVIVEIFVLLRKNASETRLFGCLSRIRSIKNKWCSIFAPVDSVSIFCLSFHAYGGNKLVPKKMITLCVIKGKAVQNLFMVSFSIESSFVWKASYASQKPKKPLIFRGSLVDSHFCREKNCWKIHVQLLKKH